MRPSLSAWEDSVSFVALHVYIVTIMVDTCQVSDLGETAEVPVNNDTSHF